LDKLEGIAGLSSYGRSWVTAALDPFHDRAIDCCGLPDGESGASIVQCVKQQMVLNNTSGSNWDCNIIQWPWFDIAPMTNYGNGSATNGFLTANVPYPAPYGTTSQAFSQAISGNSSGIVMNTAIYAGGLQAISNASGSPCGITNIQATTYGAGLLNLPEIYQNGPYRIIGAGFEVNNTTAELNLQGSVTVYTSPVPDFECASTIRVFGNGSTGNDLNGHQQANFMIQPPDTVARAQILPGSRTWEAKYGSYQVGRFTSLDIPINEDSWVQPFVETYRTGSSIAGYGSQGMTTAPGGNTIFGWTNHTWTKFDVSGAYYTGLSPSTTLTVTWNVFVERFPTYNQGELITLAKISPGLDDNALKFYSHALRSLPVGVKVSENGLGTWFKEAVQGARDYIAPALSMMPGIGPALGGLLKAGGAVADRFDVPPSGKAYTASQKSSIPKVKKLVSKARNDEIRAKNAMTRAKNAEIRARAAAKGKTVRKKKK